MGMLKELMHKQAVLGVCIRIKTTGQEHRINLEASSPLRRYGVLQGEMIADGLLNELMRQQIEQRTSSSTRVEFYEEKEQIRLICTSPFADDFFVAAGVIAIMTQS